MTKLMPTILSLLIYCASCGGQLPVTVKPKPECHLPVVPVFPDITLPTPKDIELQDLYVWVKAEEARLTKAELCLANRSN